MKHKETKYWFYLEPYTFIFQGNKQAIVYNTLNSAYILFPSSKLADNMMQELLTQGSGYCTEITDSDLEDGDFFNFTKQIRDSFSGDIVAQDENKTKPFIFKPILRLIDNFHHIKKQKETDFTLNVLRYLKEISLQITSRCDQSCPKCSEFCKQSLFCTKQDDQKDIPLNRIVEILGKIEKAGVNLVNIIGGNIFNYDNIIPLMLMLENYSFKTRFYIYYKNIDTIPKIPTNQDFTFVVLVDCNSFDKNALMYSISQFKQYKVEYLFIIESEDDFVTVEKITKEKPKLNINVKPFYNKNNLGFFQQYIFTDLEDIKNSKVDKQTIFRRQIINEIFFGQLTIKVNGEVYSNLNSPSIGNILNKDSFNKIVFNEINTGTSWLKVRNHGVCEGCCNKYLCPSPSNYEIVLNRDNLCNIVS